MPIVRLRPSSTRTPPSTTVASRSSRKGALTSPGGDGGARAELAIEIEDRRRVVLHQPELGDDLPRRFLLLDLFGEEPLQLGHLGKRLLGEAQLVEGVDLRGDALLVLERLLEDGGERVEADVRPIDRLELDRAVAREHEIEQLQAVQALLIALHLQPRRRAEKLLAIAESRHREIRVRRLELGVDLLVDGTQHSRVHRILQPLTGPPWKNFSGIMIPSFLNTSPFFITNCTFLSALMSSSGFPGMAIMSANMPALIGPRAFSVSLTL